MVFSPEDKKELLRLSLAPGVGPNKMRNLIARFRKPSDVFGASGKTLCGVPGIDQRTAERIKQFDGRTFVENQFVQLKKSGARVVTFWDEEYPEPLKEIYDPPVILFVKGTLNSEDRNAISIVGSRKPSNYGKRITQLLTSELAAKGLTIVSGLAYGTDTYAHRYALQAGSRTIAVLGSGVDVIYPSINKQLSEKISENGAVISEFPMGTQPDWKNFPRRNRIVCGLSLGTVVIEAAIKSGALITASLALEQNREVFAVPGNIDSPNSIGTNNLIKEGAQVVTKSEDILLELAPRLPFLTKEEAPLTNIVLNKEEKQLLNFLSHEPSHIDTIASESGQSTARVLSILLSLELKNIVKQHPGKLFVKI